MRGTFISVAICVALLVVASGCGDTPPNKDSAVSGRQGTLQTIARANLDGQPVAVESGRSRTWILTTRPTRLVAARLAGRQIKLRSWPLRSAGSDIAVIGQDVWVTHPRQGTITKYRGGHARNQISVPGARLLTPSGNHLWVLTTGNLLVYINAQTGRRVGPPVSLPEQMDDPRDIVASGAGDAWVGDFAGNLVRASAATFQVTKFLPTRSGGFTGLALAYSKVWGAAEERLGSVNIDGTGPYAERDLGRMATYLATSPDGQLIVASKTAENITTLDRDGRESRSWKVGDIGPVSVDDAGVVWVTQPSTRAVTAGRRAAGAQNVRSASIIREAEGTVDGVGLGDRPAAVIKRLGQPVAYGTNDRLLPLDAPENLQFAPEEGTERYEAKAPAKPALRYANAFYLVCAAGQPCAGRVGRIVVTGHGARTTRGVAIGAALSTARAKYETTCKKPTPTTSEDAALGPYCAARIGGANILFVGDPIDRIELRALE